MSTNRPGADGQPSANHPPTAARSPLAELSKRLVIPDWQERRNGDCIVLIAGSRGMVKPVSGALLLILRPKAAAAVQGVKQQLIDAGLLSAGRDALVLTRLPNETEVAMLRELVGLHRGWVQ